MVMEAMAAVPASPHTSLRCCFRRILMNMSKGLVQNKAVAVARLHYHCDAPLMIWVSPDGILSILPVADLYLILMSLLQIMLRVVAAPLLDKIVVIPTNPRRHLHRAAALVLVCQNEEDLLSEGMVGKIAKNIEYMARKAETPMVFFQASNLILL